ncbi:iron-sulfur cluster assembly scaffold protein [uncultured Adlercreutzia sp.]|uniref:iron-sulfur cluster assembly scaffold protein n=1 Tax=uncultured Adlercreutzia sp. TaxID=875803 RepID=UPI0026744DA0|nr:iron-sulfur cluster assembly scaffold protein [uncultured Adlercreutzia sp.]
MTVTVDDPAIARRSRRATHRGFEGLAPAGTAPGKAGEVREAGARGDNPFCGDELEVRVRLRRDGACGWIVEHAAFDGYACTLCLAAADALMEAAEGLTAAQARALTGEDACALLGGLEVGRTRKGCVELPATVLSRALLTVVE